MKFTENAKPLVKVGGGYVSLEVFIGYILEKINKINSLNKNSNTITKIDPDLIQRLNDYLTEMNNINLQKAENTKRESFQGLRFSPENKSMKTSTMSPRGNFLKAVVEKEDISQCGIHIKSRKSLQLTQDFSINVIGNNK